VWDPLFFLSKPRLWYKILRDAWCLEVMHRAFTRGLMQYGMMTATKKEVA
jgi:MPBQ/MSBQ methyltransferase